MRVDGAGLFQPAPKKVYAWAGIWNGSSALPP